MQKEQNENYEKELGCRVAKVKVWDDNILESFAEDCGHTYV